MRTLEAPPGRIDAAARRWPGPRAPGPRVGTMRHAAAIAAALTLACGGFSNDPFLTGRVAGQLGGADQGAVVFVFGRPEIVATPDPGGRFTLEGVPVGPAEIIASAGDRAARASVQVRSAEVIDLGPLEATPATRIALRVRGDAYQRIQGTATVVGTPFPAVAFEGGEPAPLPALPSGCWVVVAGARGFLATAKELCFEAPAAAAVSIVIGVDATAPAPGCATVGCEVGLLCGADGACSACVACGRDGDCSGGRCVSVKSAVGEIKVCARLACTGSGTCGDCPFGEKCDNGLCRPDDSTVERCGGGAVFGASCDRWGDDLVCRAALDDGFCDYDAGRFACSVRCDDARDCPCGHVCDPLARACRRP